MAAPRKSDVISPKRDRAWRADDQNRRRPLIHDTPMGASTVSASSHNVDVIIEYPTLAARVGAALGTAKYTALPVTRRQKRRFDTAKSARFRRGREEMPFARTTQHYSAYAPGAVCSGHVQRHARTARCGFDYRRIFSGARGRQVYIEQNFSRPRQRCSNARAYTTGMHTMPRSRVPHYRSASLERMKDITIAMKDMHASPPMAVHIFKIEAKQKRRYAER